MTFTLEEIALYLLIGLNILLVIWLTHLELKSRDIAILKDKTGLRNKLNSLDKELENLRQFEKASLQQFKLLENRLGDSIQNIEIVRFNPFKQEGVGGDQSFATTFLNKQGDGVILSSLYAREKVRVFAKPVKNWQSKYELSEEEISVLNKTKASA